MFRYLPASFLFTSQVTEEERIEIDKTYMPFVLERSHKIVRDLSNVRTDYFDRSVEPWGLFVEVMFQYFSKFVGGHLLSSGSYVVQFKPWFNYYVTGSAMVPHSHPFNDFGVVYCLRNAGRKATLFDTFSHEYACLEERYPNIEKCSFKWHPVPGEFAFFPASLFHATQATEIDGERITLVANIVIVEEGKSEKLSLRVEHPPGTSSSPSHGTFYP